MSENAQTKTIKAYNLRAGDMLVRKSGTFKVADAYTHYRTGRVVVDLMGYPRTPTFEPDEDVEVEV